MGLCVTCGGRVATGWGRRRGQGGHEEKAAPSLLLPLPKYAKYLPYNNNSAKGTLPQEFANPNLSRF